MRTTYMTAPVNFCIHCKETGGELPQAPLTFYCMMEQCLSPDKQCEYVKHGGVRPE